MNIAIIIPVHKSNITEFERISLLQCLKILNNYPIYLVTYKKLDVTVYKDVATKFGTKKIKFKYFNQKYFRNDSSYNRFCLSACLYREFLNFKYILIYQLDCFVFKDSLSEWCSLGFDFVGAPWTEENNGNISLGKVGNGGLSLRNTESFYSLFSSYKYVDSSKYLYIKFLSNVWPDRFKKSFKFIYDLSFGSLTRSSLNTFNDHEDIYIGYYLSPKYLKLPTSELALEFSFETHPRFLYKLNRSKMPFGCHAWWTYDLDFFSEFVQDEGYIVVSSNWI